MAYSFKAEFTGKEAERFYDALEKINKIVESDIPEQMFIMALLQIKKHVKDTGYFGKFS